MSVFIKICGLTDFATAQAVAALGPDALGFVFWPRSKRAVRAEEIGRWAADLPPRIRRVGVFVDAEFDAIRDTVERARLHAVQLQLFQSLENPEKLFPIIGKLKSANLEPGTGNLEQGLTVWQAIQVGGPVEPAVCELVDAVVVDRYSADEPGGTGRVGDWSLARARVERNEKPVVLAGGLNPENVAGAIRAVRPWGVDVSSGVESAPGRKDPARVKDFIEQCRSL